MPLRWLSFKSQISSGQDGGDTAVSALNPEQLNNGGLVGRILGRISGLARSGRQPANVAEPPVAAKQDIEVLHIVPPQKSQDHPINAAESEIWIKSHPVFFQEFARTLLQNIRQIRAAEFEDALVASWRKWEKYQNENGIKDTVFMILGKNKSGYWALNILGAKGLISNNADIVYYDDMVTWLKDHPKIKDIVYVDDGMFTGMQLGAVKHQVNRKLKDNGMENVSLHVVIPYYSELAFERAGKDVAKFGFEKLPYISDVFKKMRPRDIDPQAWDNEAIWMFFMRSFGINQLEDLTYFARRTPAPVFLNLFSAARLFPVWAELSQHSAM